MFKSSFQEMQALYVLRAAKEDLKIEHLANEEKRAAAREQRDVERHEWERQRYHWDRQKRQDEWDLHQMKMVEEGLDEDDVPRRRPCDVPPPPTPPPAWPSEASQ